MKKRFQKIYIFDRIPFHVVTAQEVIKQIIELTKYRKVSLVLNMNAYGMAMFLRNRPYASIIRAANLIYADGWGPVLFSKFTSDITLSERVNVGDFIYDLIENVQINSLRLYLLGTDEKTVELTVECLKKMFPQLIVCGFHSGFFESKDEQKVVKNIKKAKPNIVLVGMGIPKQEYFIHKYRNELPSSVYMGIGGVFHYIAQTKSRAPKWMRKSGMEWLYRFFQEPRRLFSRYTFDNVYLLYYWLVFVFYKKMNLKS